MSKTILIIEDSKTEMEEIKSFLKIFDVTLLEAFNGKEGKNTAIEKHPDLILLDVILPDIDGFNIARELKKDDETKNIPIIFVTSKGEDVDKFWGKKIGGAAYITKPVNKELLLAEVKKIIG